MNYALLGDVGQTGDPRWTKNTSGSAWTDKEKRQPIEPKAAAEHDTPTEKERAKADQRRLKLLMVENNFAQLPKELVEVDVYYFDDRTEFIDHTRAEAQIPAHINFHTVHWDHMGYIKDGWTEDTHPVVAKSAERHVYLR